jgi:hypothetical protein
VIPRRQCSGAQVHRRSCGFRIDNPADHLVWLVQVSGVVGERRVGSEAAVETSGGAHTSENAGMSSERRVGNPSAE